MINQSPILITGCPRSGTTIVANAIQKAGAFIGQTSIRGMMENDEIREKLIRPYFKQKGLDCRGQFLKQHNVSIPTDWNVKIENILKSQGLTANNIWMYKGLGCLIWPIWNYTYPDAKWIIVRRRTGDIIQSCMKTAYMTAFNTEEGWKDWVHQYENKFVEMIEAGLNCKIVWPERILNGNYTQIYETIEWCGLKWNDQIIPTINQLLHTNKERT